MDNLNPENLTPAEEIKKAEEQGNKALETITLTRQADGNWKCKGIKNGKELEIRAGKPEDGLVEFLTHA